MARDIKKELEEMQDKLELYGQRTWLNVIIKTWHIALKRAYTNVTADFKKNYAPHLKSPDHGLTLSTVAILLSRRQHHTLRSRTAMQCAPTTGRR